MEQSNETNTKTSPDLDHVPPRALTDLKDETAKLLTAPSNFCFKVPMAPEDWSVASVISQMCYIFKSSSGIKKPLSLPSLLRKLLLVQTKCRISGFLEKYSLPGKS